MISQETESPDPPLKIPVPGPRSVPDSMIITFDGMCTQQEKTESSVHVSFYLKIEHYLDLLDKFYGEFENLQIPLWDIPRRISVGDAQFQVREGSATKVGSLPKPLVRRR